MKKIMFATVVLLVAITASAQRDNFAMQIDVPFAFQVHGEKLPAGVYTVEYDANGNGPFLVRDKIGRHGAFAQSTGVSEKTDSNAAVVFTLIGDSYQMSEIVDPRVGVRRLVGVPEAPKELVSTKRVVFAKK